MSVIMSLSQASERLEDMVKDFVDCPELAGKTIRNLRIHKSKTDGVEVQIDLTDGTSFACCISAPPVVSASVYRGGIGTPKVIREYEV